MRPEACPAACTWSFGLAGSKFLVLLPEESRHGFPSLTLRAGVSPSLTLRASIADAYDYEFRIVRAVAEDADCSGGPDAGDGGAAGVVVGVRQGRGASKSESVGGDGEARGRGDESSAGIAGGAGCAEGRRECGGCGHCGECDDRGRGTDELRDRRRFVRHLLGCAGAEAVWAERQWAESL